MPAYYYVQFMQDNGLHDRIDAMLADPDFRDRPEVRDARLEELRKTMKNAPVDAAFQQLLAAKMSADYPGLIMRFRTSTNSEDLDGFPCAGCYESHTGDPLDWGGRARRAPEDLGQHLVIPYRAYNGVEGRTRCQGQAKGDESEVHDFRGAGHSPATQPRPCTTGTAP